MRGHRWRPWRASLRHRWAVPRRIHISFESGGPLIPPSIFTLVKALGPSRSCRPMASPLFS